MAGGKKPRISIALSEFMAAQTSGLGGLPRPHRDTLKPSMDASVRLPAQEGRYLKLILVVLVMHRSLPAVLVETLRC